MMMATTAREISVYLYDVQCTATEHRGLTVCQRCDTIVNPFIETRMTGTIQVASTDAPREPFLIASTLCQACWTVWQEHLLTDQKYHGATLTYLRAQGCETPSPTQPAP